MRLLLKSYNSPLQNIAFEEQLFKTFEEDTLRLWINPKSVICGKHQNAYAESNYHYCRNNEIPIIRRLSGGGTVFHDSGNINFSFFRMVDSINPINYERNLKLIQSALIKIGYDIQISPRNDLFSGNFKISGNAQHISGGRALHHGTILYNADLYLMKPAIKRESGVYIDKAVKSVRSPVVNLKSLQNCGSTMDFYELLTNQLLEHTESCNVDDPIDEELLSKYQSARWNFGYGPGYTFENKRGHDHLKIAVNRGGEITATDSNNMEWNKRLRKLVGKHHTWEDVISMLDITNAMDLELSNLLF
ncbi:MAG: lipoate--protein ligase [Salibacteraceae bacterium]